MPCGGGSSGVGELVPGFDRAVAGGDALGSPRKLYLEKRLSRLKVPTV
jgi:hypothetical protein